MTPKPMQLELTKGEVNYILSALGEKPYNEVSALIAKITQQVEP